MSAGTPTSRDCAVSATKVNQFHSFNAQGVCRHCGKKLADVIAATL